ncbi:MAG TPA: ABC transporter ATP-binding protein [Cyclobacteriaceae bacterium]|nr:ABC transporter ATP-binding protein [Cyclobacteriaceae bacterium]
MTPILEIQHVSKRFHISHRGGAYLSLREKILGLLSFEQNQIEEFWALDDVSFCVNPGETIGIIGSNGAGKSTLLKILSKITPPTKGKIISRGRIASLLEVGTGFHPELTGRENIFFNGSLLGMKRKEIELKFDEIVDFSGVANFLDTSLKHYSSGMQLRLAFAVAAFLEPEILVVDEVLAVGDAEFQKKCMGKMEDVSKSGRTILFVSHNLSAMAQLCQRSLLLKSGKLMMLDQTNRVIDQYIAQSRDNSFPETISIVKGMELKEMEFKLNHVSGRNELEFGFTVSQLSANVLSGFAILIYNSLNERIAIVDLRSTELFKISSARETYRITGKVNSLPLVEGHYDIGVYIASNLFQGNKYHLGRFEILPAEREIIPYAVRDRGYIELVSTFQISAR